MLRLGQLLAYWVVQFAGAFIAAGLAYALWGHKITLGASHPGPEYSYVVAFLTEIVARWRLA